MRQGTAPIDATEAGRRIEAASFATIDQWRPKDRYTDTQWRIVRRIVHTTGDPSLAAAVRFLRDPLEAAAAALHRCAPIFADAAMIQAGINTQRLRAVHPGYGPGHIVCLSRDPAVGRAAAARGTTRAAAAVRAAAPRLNGAIALVGNAPTALLELVALARSGQARPAVVVAAPVGFVNVCESKRAFADSDLPGIVVEGNRGGSAVAVAALHGLCETAPAGPVASCGRAAGFDAYALIGHGSAVPDSDRAMRQVASDLEARLGRPVACCHMSLCPPSLEDTVAELARAGAASVLVLPYFLSTGTHVRRDIPEVVAAVRRRHPEMTIALGPNLGYDPAFADILERRIQEVTP